jgi:uncharacterized protein YdeI (YjbR/CyaY-like superfamily)
MRAPDGRALVEVTSVDALHRWLEWNCHSDDSVWLVTFKKGAGARYVSTSEVLDELVAFGWTDGIRQKVDDERTMQLISPRRTKPWAKSYKDRAERLIAEGRMTPTGQASLDEARSSGAWDAMNDVDAFVIPDDLRNSLSASPPALDNFLAFPPSTRRNILRWIALAKTDATRSRRVARVTVDAIGNVRTPVNG